jgi:hypothetical protein
MTDVTEATEVKAHRDGYPTHRRKMRFDWANTSQHPSTEASTQMAVDHLGHWPAARAAREAAEAHQRSDKPDKQPDAAENVTEKVEI